MVVHNFANALNKIKTPNKCDNQEKKWHDITGNDWLIHKDLGIQQKHLFIFWVWEHECISMYFVLCLEKVCIFGQLINCVQI